jgi:hypothetical protein
MARSSLTTKTRSRLALSSLTSSNATTSIATVSEYLILYNLLDQMADYYSEAVSTTSSFNNLSNKKKKRKQPMSEMRYTKPTK